MVTSSFCACRIHVTALHCLRINIIKDANFIVTRRGNHEEATCNLRDPFGIFFVHCAGREAYGWWVHPFNGGEQEGFCPLIRQHESGKRQRIEETCFVGEVILSSLERTWLPISKLQIKPRSKMTRQNGRCFSSSQAVWGSQSILRSGAVKSNNFIQSLPSHPFLLGSILQVFVAFLFWMLKTLESRTSEFVNFMTPNRC